MTQAHATQQLPWTDELAAPSALPREDPEGPLPVTLTHHVQPAQSLLSGQLLAPFASPGGSWQPGPRIRAACQEQAARPHHHPHGGSEASGQCVLLALAQQPCGKHSPFPSQDPCPHKECPCKLPAVLRKAQSHKGAAKRLGGPHSHAGAGLP